MATVISTSITRSAEREKIVSGMDGVDPVSRVLAAATPAAAVGRSLRANFCWVLAGNAIYSFCQWMILVALAKLVQPAMLGQFALGLAIASPTLTFANLQLRAVQATDARAQYQFSDYFSLRIITTSAGLLAISLIAFLGSFDLRTAAVIVAVGMAKAVESFSDLFYGLFQRYEDLKRVGVSMMLRGVLSAAALTGVLYLTRNVMWSTLAMMAAWGCIWAAHDLRWGRRMLRQQGGLEGTGRPAGREGHPLRPRFDWARHWSLFRLAFPLGVVMMLVALNLNIPRYFVAYHLGEENLGIFSALAYTMVAMTGVSEALGQSATPKLAKYFADRRISPFRSLVIRLTAVVVVLGAAGVAVAKVFGRTLLGVLYMPRYAQHADVFVWLCVAAAATGMASMLSASVTAARRFKVQVPMFAAVCLTTTAGCYLLVPLYGMLGAAIAISVSALAHTLIAIGLLAWVLFRSDPRRQESLELVESPVSPALEA